MSSKRTRKRSEPTTLFGGYLNRSEDATIKAVDVKAPFSQFNIGA